MDLWCVALGASLVPGAAAAAPSLQSFVRAAGRRRRTPPPAATRRALFASHTQPRAGYLAGCYFRAFNLTGDPRWAELGGAELAGLAPVAGETDSHKGSHLFDSSFVEALQAGALPGTDPEELEGVLQTAAEALAKRWVPGVRHGRRGGCRSAQCCGAGLRRAAEPPLLFARAGVGPHSALRAS